MPGSPPAIDSLGVPLIEIPASAVFRGGSLASAPAVSAGSGYPTATIDAEGPAITLYAGTSTDLAIFPTACAFLPNGNLFVCFMSENTSTMRQVLKAGVWSLTPNGTGGITATPVVAASVIASSAAQNMGNAYLTSMADGRLLLAYSTTPGNINNPGNTIGMSNGSAAGGVAQITIPVSSAAANVVTVTNAADEFGNPLYDAVLPGMYVVPDSAHGIPAGTTVTSVSTTAITLSNAPSAAPANISFYSSNPDGGSGNIQYMIGTVSGSTVTWSSPLTLNTGFSVSAGFDYIGGGPAIEPVNGSLILPVLGSNTSNQLGIATEIGWVVGTYSPNGSISWASFVNGPTPPATCASNENSIVIDAAGTWHMTFRSNSGVGGATLSNGIRHATCSTNPTGPSYSNAAWNSTSSISSNLISQPALTKLPDGTLMFPSRSGFTRYTLGFLASSVDNGSTWQTQAFDTSDTTHSLYRYGQILNVPGAPGAALFIYSLVVPAGNTSTILCRPIISGAGIGPYGSHLAISGAFQKLRAQEVVADKLVIGPTGSAETGVGLSSESWKVAKSYERLTNPSSVLADYPLYVPSRPLPEYTDLRTDVAMVWQNFARTSIGTDSGGSLLTSGTMYLVRLDWVDQQAFINSAFWRYLNLYCGATAQPSGGHAWATLLNSTLTKQIATSDVTTGFTANGHIKFDFGATESAYSGGPFYLGLVFVGTPPSLLGKSVSSAVTLDAPFICGNSSGAGAGLTTPSSFTGPAVTPSAGGAFIPWLGLSET